MAPSVTAMHGTSHNQGYSPWDGERHAAGFGDFYFDDVDYHALRERSGQFFRRNHYAAGIIERLVTNEIHNGLSLELGPNPDLLGLARDEAAKWGSEVEARWDLWAECTMPDALGQQNLAELLQTIRRESLIDGDVLVILDISAIGLPEVRLVASGNVRTPAMYSPPEGRKIVEGVEVDQKGRHVGYWVCIDKKETFVPRYGSSGRLQSWMVYGSAKRHSDVRGMPLLSCVLQSLDQLGEYRDAALVKAKLAAKLAIFIERTYEGQSSGVAGRAGRDITAQVAPTGGARPGEYRRLGTGTVLYGLAVGEKPVPFSTQSSDISFGQFEQAVLNSVAWYVQVPVEILQLAYTSSYSAGQGAVKEFRMYLEKTRYLLANQITKPIYREWLLGEVLAGRVKADGLLEARRDPSRYVEVEAWFSSDWSGQIKPSTDLGKDVKAAIEGISAGLITRAQAARDLFGNSFDTNVIRLVEENEALRAANPVPPPGSVQYPVQQAPQDDGPDEKDDDEKDLDNERTDTPPPRDGDPRPSPVRRRITPR